MACIVTYHLQLQKKIHPLITRRTMQLQIQLHKILGNIFKIK